MHSRGRATKADVVDEVVGEVEVAKGAAADSEHAGVSSSAVVRLAVLSKRKAVDYPVPRLFM